MGKHILLLQGSPRFDGNSADLADVFRLGATDAGHTVSMPEVNGKYISGCLACNKCRRNGGFCVIRDYMDNLYYEFAKADVIAMVTPIYFFALPAQIKAILDRCYCYGPNYPKKEFVLILTSADDHESVFSPMIDYYRHLIEFLGWDDIGLLTVHGLSDKGMAKLMPAYEQAYRLAQSV